MKKEKIIKFSPAPSEIWGIPKSEVIRKILPVLKKEHDLWLKSGFIKEEQEYKFRGKKMKRKEFQDFIQYLEEKYENKKTKTKRPM